MIGSLWSEGHTAGHLSVGPDFTLKRLNLEDFVLEEHLVLLDGLPDAHVLAAESGHGALLSPLKLGLRLCSVVRVITVKVTLVLVVLASLNGLLNLVALFLLLLREL